MNWKEIAEKCPNATDALFDKFDYLEFNDKWELGWYYKDGIHIWMAIWMPFDLRDLYDFFDGQEIFVWPSPEIQYTREIDEDDRNPHYVPEEWAYEIHDTAYELDIGYPYKTRQEAEEAAFTKAFEILEEKLNIND